MRLLDKNSIKVLKTICKLSKNDISIDNPAIVARELPKMNPDALFDALDNLYSQKYITGLYADNLLNYINPTHKGKTYFEIRHKEFLYFLGKSVLVPIFVAVIVSLITSYWAIKK